MGQPVIVLAHPHDDTREMYADFLGHKRLTVFAVDDCDAAMAVAGRADVIITSARLHSHDDGIDLVERIRRDLALAGIPIVVLSSTATPPERMRAEEVGCDEFLSIPCLPQDLYRAIRRVLLRRISGQTVKAQHPPALPRERHHKSRHRA